MARVFLVVTAVGRDRRGTVEMITDLAEVGNDLDVDIDVKGPRY